jgi:hypothetical protein
VKPQIGRTFTEEEDENGAQVAVISYGLWMRRYGGSPDVVGRKALINGLSYEITGVMPRGFYFMPARDIDIWMSASFSPGLRQSFGWRDAQVVARLKPGLAIGLGLSVLAARLMTALFYGVRPDYGLDVVAVSVILLAVATLACFVRRGWRRRWIRWWRCGMISAPTGGRRAGLFA